MSNLSKMMPTLLACAGAIGVGVTAVLAARGHIKAKDILDEIEFEEDEPFVERAKTVVIATWKDYGPAVVSGIITVGCVLGSNHVHLKTEAALVGLAGVLGNQIRKMDRSFIKEYGTDKLKEIKKKIFEEDRNLDKKFKEFHQKEDKVEGYDVYYEPFTDQLFSATEKDILKAETELNKRFHTNLEVSLYEFLEMIPDPNLEALPGTEELKWCMDDYTFDIEGSPYGYYISLDVEPYTTSRGEQVSMIVYSVVPKEESDEHKDTAASFPAKRAASRRVA